MRYRTCLGSSRDGHSATLHAVTSPVAFTEATVTSELVHTIDRP
jgi:hypothetical protein